MHCWAKADLLQARAAQSNSFAGRIGRGIAPVFKPLGFDWQLTVGVMTSFPRTGGLCFHDGRAGRVAR